MAMLPTPPVQLKNNFAGWFLALWNYLLGLILALNTKTPQTYRAVITSIAAFTVASSTGVLTASANGFIGTQDGVTTLAAGDRVFLPVVTGGAGAGSVTQVISGPYLIQQVGVTSVSPFILVRPPEYAQGSTIGEGVTFTIGSEGTAWAGNSWRAFPAGAAQVVGTNAPNFYPRTFSAQATEAVAITNFWILDVNKVKATQYTNTGGAAHALYTSTLVAGAGTGQVTVTGTGGDLYSVFAENF